MYTFGQGVDPTGGWGELIAANGPFAIVAMILIYILNLLWKAYRDKDAEVARLNGVMVTDVVPLILDGTNVLKDAAAAMRENQLASSDLQKLVDRMDSMKVMLDQLHDDLLRGGRR